MAGVIVHCRTQPYFAQDNVFYEEAYENTSNTTTTGEADVVPDEQMDTLCVWTLFEYGS